MYLSYCIVSGKRPWVLAAQTQKIGGGPLHGEPAWMFNLPNLPALSENLEWRVHKSLSL